MNRVSNNKILVFIAGLALLLLTVSGCTADTTLTTTTTTHAAATTTAATTGSGEAASGTVAVYVTDAPPDKEVTAVVVTVSGLRIHRAEAEQEQSGTGNQTQEQEQQSGDGGEWIDIPISGNMTTFDLLQVRDVQAFFGSANVTAGTYTQVRIVVDAARVSTSDGETHDATVNSGEIKIVRPFDIVEGETTELLLDFDADHSVTFTGNGKVMVKPVINLSIDTRHQGQPVETDTSGNNEPEGGMGYGYSCDQFQEQNNLTDAITVPAGNVLTISLCANHTTGFQWSEQAVVSDTGILVQTGHEYTEPDNEDGVVGAAGREVYTFDTLSPGETTLYFEYSQPWEGGEQAAWTFGLTVTVQ